MITTICRQCGHMSRSDDVELLVMEYLIHLIKEHWEYVVILHSASPGLIEDVRRLATERTIRERTTIPGKASQ